MAGFQERVGALTEERDKAKDALQGLKASRSQQRTLDSRITNGILGINKLYEALNIQFMPDSTLVPKH